MRKALVTGSSGFVGFYLCDLLEDRGFTVIPFDIKHGLDIRDYESVRLVLEDHQPDYIFHLAAQSYVPETSADPVRGFDVNVMGTLNILEAIRKTGCNARVLITGTSEEYGYESHPPESVVTEHTVPRPTTPYGASKLAAGQLGLVYAGLYGIPVIVTRAYNHIGPGQSPVYAVSGFAKKVAEAEKYGSTVMHGNLVTCRNYTDVRDIVEAYLLAIDQPFPGIYNVCSDYTVEMNWVMDKLVSMSNEDIDTSIDPKLFRKNVGGFPKPSCENFRNATGWQPARKLEYTLEEMLDYWRARV